MSKGLEELKRLAYENACCRCQYYIDKKCTNNYECVWKTIEKELKALEIIKLILFSKLKAFETTEKADTTTITKGNYYCIEFKVGKETERLYIPKEEYDLLKEVLL